MNKGIKKVLSCILAAVIAVSINGFDKYNKAYAESMTVKEKQYSAMDFLRQLSIVPDYYDYNTDLNDTVTRADFAAAVARAIKANDYSGKPIFYDVSELHWAFKEISALAAREIVFGGEGKLFRPDESITKAEAYALVCNVTGYGDIAKMDGEYPTGYLRAAHTAEIDKYVSASDKVTVGDMFMIIYNAIKTNLLVISGGSASGLVYETDKEKTLLSEYYDIYYNKGILNGLNGTCIDGSHLSEGYIHIGDFKYLTEVAIDEYFGEEIEFFYRHDESTGKNTVIWAKPTSKDTDTLFIEVNHNASFNKDTYTFTYEVNDREKRVKIDPTATVLYNGAITGENLAELLVDGRYTVKLLSKNNSAYKTVIIKQCENYYVTGINSAQNIIYQSGNGLKTCELNLNPDNYDNLTISLYGAAKSFADIQKGYVLSVFLSKDKKIAKVNIVTDKVTGTVEKIEEDDYGKTITIDNEELFMPKSAGGVNFSCGQEVTFYLDVNGEIAYVKLATASFEPAYIIKVKKNNREENVELKLLTSDGIVSRKQTAEKVIIDGKKYTTLDEVYGILNDIIQDRFVLIRLDKNEKVTMIDSSSQYNGGVNDTLAINIPYVSSGVPFIKARNSFRNYCVVDDNTVFFMVPENENIDDVPDSFFRVCTKDVLSDQKKNYKIQTYKTTKRIGYEQFVVIKGASEATENKAEHAPIFVKKILQGINKDDELANILVGYTGATEVEYVIDNKIWQDGLIKEGDIIKYELNLDDEITDIELTFGLDKLTPGITKFSTTYGESKGYVDDLTDGVLTITKECGVNVRADADDADRVVVPGTTPCLIYDTNETGDARIRYGSIEEAKTYTDSKKNCSMIYEYHAKGTPKMFVVYLNEHFSN